MRRIVQNLVKQGCSIKKLIIKDIDIYGEKTPQNKLKKISTVNFDIQIK